MTAQSLNSLDIPIWDYQVARNTEMFYEADRLDNAAYQIIADGPSDSVAWARYTAAKQVADNKRTEAYQDWIRLKREMNSNS